MAVYVDTGGGGGGAVFPPKGTQLPFLIYHFNVPELSAQWGTSYIGTDSPNTGLLITTGLPENFLTFTPIPFFTPGEPFQSGVILTPLQLAWYTQIRRTHRSVISVASLDKTSLGGSAASVLCCFSATNIGGQTYALTASNDVDTPGHPLILHIQRWIFPNVCSPFTTGLVAPATRFQIINLLNCGLIDNNQRIFFEAVDHGSFWRLNAIVSNVDVTNLHVVGTVDDSTIGAGMPALAAITFSSISPIKVFDFVGGFGPNDQPFVP